jgi:hypothetical protein
MMHRALTRSFAVVAAFYAVSGGPAAAQDVAKYPDWSGQWQNTSGIQWDQTKPLGPGQQAPLTPEYLVRYEANRADQAAGGLGDDPTGQCIPHGMPRVMTVVYPMEIIVTPKTTYILTDYTVPRRIYTDGRDWPKEPDPSFNGYSIGRWTDATGSGAYDTLEVETRDFKGPRSYEASGLRLHDDNQTVIKERIFRDKAERDILIDEITIIDNGLTRPWTVAKRYRHDSAATPIWHFNDCAENNRHVIVGTESYLISGDGFLMPTKRGQQPPDARYFTRSRGAER